MIMAVNSFFRWFQHETGSAREESSSKFYIGKFTRTVNIVHDSNLYRSVKKINNFG